MKITVELCDSRSSLNIRTKLPSRELKVTSDTEMTISGFHNDKPSLLIMQKEGELTVASFFLHANVTAHVHSGTFDIFITNTHHFIGCLICNRYKPFTTTQEMEYTGIDEVRTSDTLLNDFVFIQEHQTTTIEYLNDERETEKIASC